MDEGGEERLDPPAAHRLEEIDVPTLILEAEHDPPDMKRLADFLVREVIGSRKVVVEGADHVLNMRQPERFEDLVLPFLADTAP
jgi:3-oxoadipate enol-lactonase